MVFGADLTDEQAQQRYKAFYNKYSIFRFIFNIMYAIRFSGATILIKKIIKFIMVLSILSPISKNCVNLVDLNRAISKLVKDCINMYGKSQGFTRAILVVNKLLP